jgi:hypothetical protein
VTGPVRLDVELPEGWCCFDLAVPSDQLTELLDHQYLRAFAQWLRDNGASIALMRQGDEVVPGAICGGVFVLDRMPVDGAVLFALLDADGEPVALGDLGGLPIVAHIRRESTDGPVAVLHVTYFICAPGMCVVIAFGGREIGGVRGVVEEVAKIVSAARVVHCEGGCPV